VPDPTTSRSTAVSATGSPAGIVVTPQTLCRGGAVAEGPS
jgi:hypothetical protein